MAVFLFYGQEEYLMDKEINKLKNELINSDFISMGYKTFDNPNFSQLLDCIQSSPLMFGNTLSVINMEKYLVGNGISLDDKQIESIDFALKNISDNVNIIFVCKIQRDETKKPDSRKKLYKTISKYCEVKEFAQYKNYDKKLPLIITEILKEKELKADSRTINTIIEQLGVNLTLINSETEKLKIAVYPKNVLTSDDIKKYCTSSEDIFILTDLIIQGNKNEILKQYHLLTERRHYLEVFGFIQSSLQRYVFIKNYEKKMSTKDMSLKLKIHEFIVQKTLEKLRKISFDRLLQIRKNLIQAEYKLKSGQISGEDLALELALLN